MNRFPQVRAGVRRELQKVVQQTTEAVRAGAVARIMDPNKTGRIYRRETAVSFTSKKGPVGFTAYKGSATEHQASAPGEAPANDQGILAGSITAEMVGPMTGLVDVGAEYGPPLEYGGVNEARPFVGPTMEAERFPFHAAVEGALQRGSKA